MKLSLTKEQTEYLDNVGLSRAVGRLLGLRPALVTYFPRDNEKAALILENIGKAHGYYCRVNSIPAHVCQPDSLVMPTDEFVQRWSGR